jgi:hypothetical protein
MTVENNKLLLSGRKLVNENSETVKRSARLSKRKNN